MNFARRLIIDTGVLVSAAIRPGSVPAVAFERALRHFDVCASVATLGELDSLLLRPKFDVYASIQLRMAFCSSFRERVLIIEPTDIVTDCSDPGDNKFLSLALVAEAELIIANDPHLTALHPWRGIPILPPAAFLVGVR